MKKAVFIGTGIFIGYYLVNRNHNRLDTMPNAELIVKMILGNASADELKTAGDLIRKYCPEL